MKTIKCPFCNGSVPANHIFCGHCGKQLQDEGTTKLPPIPKESLITCPHCHKETPANGRICDQCGQNLS